MAETKYKVCIEKFQKMGETSDLEKAKAAIRSNNRKKAWRLLQQHIAIVPDDIDAWLMLGGLAEPSKRKVYLRVAEKLDPENPLVKQAINWAEGQYPTAKSEESIGSASASNSNSGYSTISNEKQDGQTHQTEPIAENEPDPSKTAIVKGMSLIKSKSEKDLSEMRKEDTSEPNKAWSLIKQVGFGFLVLILILLLATGIFFRVKGQEPVIFGHRIIIVTSGSMAPTFQAGSIILLNTQAKPPFQVGEVVMFIRDSDTEMNVTHRIIDVFEEDGVRFLQTKGDNNEVTDQELITDENIVGTYANFTIPYLGYFFSFIRSREGILLLAILLGFYLVITQVFRIKELIAKGETPIDPE